MNDKDRGNGEMAESGEDQFERTRRIYREAYAALAAAAGDPENMRPDVVAYREILKNRARK